MKKGFDTNKKYIKSEINCYSRISKEGSRYVCVSVIVTDSVFKMGESYYPKHIWRIKI